jgi:hypothetical protein
LNVKKSLMLSLYGMGGGLKQVSTNGKKMMTAALMSLPLTTDITMARSVKFAVFHFASIAILTLGLITAAKSDTFALSVGEQKKTKNLTATAAQRWTEVRPMAEIKLTKRIKYAEDVYKELTERAGFPLDLACDFLNNIPDADAVEVVHGRWEHKFYPTVWYDPGEPPEWVCSVCQDRAYNTYDFCPNCGAKMDAKEENV